jgi:hypothetical protein
LILEEYRNAKNGWNYIHEKVRDPASAAIGIGKFRKLLKASSFGSISKNKEQ